MTLEEYNSLMNEALKILYSKTSATSRNITRIGTPRKNYKSDKDILVLAIMENVGKGRRKKYELSDAVIIDKAKKEIFQWEDNVYDLKESHLKFT